jgi:hypothetical protein
MRWRRWRRRGRERSGERAANTDALPRADASVRGASDRFAVDLALAAGSFEHVAPRSARMKIADDSPQTVSALDRPNSYIGQFI